MVDIRVTRFEFDLDGYTYTAHYGTTSVREGWTIVRRKQGDPHIPPYMEILTGFGWVGVIQNIEQAIVFPTKDDVVGFVEDGDEK